MPLPRRAAGASACWPRATRSATASAPAWPAWWRRPKWPSSRRPPPSAWPRRGSAGRCAELTALSLHGKSLDLVRPHLHPGRRVLALTSDAAGPAALAALLAEAGFGASRLTVLEALGGPDERVRTTAAAGFALADVAPLNLVAVEVGASAGARILPLAAGRADALFEHDGQLTKREIRAVTLAALAPCRGELLWDIGAGSGSVAIEWMLADPSTRALAIEQEPVRAARIAANAAACGVPGLTVVTAGRRRRSPASPLRMPSSSAAAAAMRACSRQPRKGCVQAAAWSPMP